MALASEYTCLKSTRVNENFLPCEHLDLTPQYRRPILAYTSYQSHTVLQLRSINDTRRTVSRTHLGRRSEDFLDDQ